MSGAMSLELFTELRYEDVETVAATSADVFAAMLGIVVVNIDMMVAVAVEAAVVVILMALVAVVFVEVTL